MMFPTVYELDDVGEATGTVYRFCGNLCADAFRMEALSPSEQFASYSWDEEHEDSALDAEKCMQCGSYLPEKP